MSRKTNKLMLKRLKTAFESVNYCGGLFIRLLVYSFTGLLGGW